MVCHDTPANRPSCAPHGQRAFYLGPSLDHYRCSWVYVVRTTATRTSATLDHYPDPLFHFEDPSPSAAVPLPDRLDPSADGSDLIGRWFRCPDLGVCRVMELGPPSRLAPGTAISAAGPVSATLNYSTTDGQYHTASVVEVADWLARYAHTPVPTDPPITDRVVDIPDPGPTPPLRRSPRLNPHLALGSAGVSDPPEFARPGAPYDFTAHHLLLLAGGELTPRLDPTIPILNLDPASGKPLTYTLAISGPDSDLWISEDGAELRKLFCTTKCLIAVHSPTSTPTYYKRVVKEK